MSSSSTLNSPKISTSFHFPILRNSSSIEKSSHRSSFHLSNIFQSLTKFSRNIRTTNPNDSQIKLTRRSFNKNDSITKSIIRPSSCFVLLSPTKHEQCLFFQKTHNENLSSKIPNSSSSFQKIKRVSSFLLPLKRRQSLSLNHSLNERSFKAKESTKRRSRLLNYSIFKHRTSLIIKDSLSFQGKFGYNCRQSITIDLIRPIEFRLDIIEIDLILQIQLNYYLSHSYSLLSTDIPHWSLIKLIRPFFGVLLDKQTLVCFQPKLFDNQVLEKDICQIEFVYFPLQQIRSEENCSIQIGYDRFALTTLRIPSHWITKNHLDEYQISSKFTSTEQSTIFMHDHHQLFGNAALISEALRHYQRLENEVPTKKSRHHYQIKECQIRPIIIHQAVTQKIKPISHHFDPIQLRRKQCSSTLIDEDIPIISNRHLHCLTASRTSSRLSTVQTSSLVGCITQPDQIIPAYANIVSIESTKLTSNFYYTSTDKRIKSARANVIKEIYKTEHDYLGHLKNLVDGYLKKMRLRKDLFSEKQIELLMGNIEELYQFQQVFFQLLKLSINEQNPHESLIGKCFLLYKEDFKKYADYCINHPLSCLELAKLEHNPIYQEFFETCRLQANMIELKLDGFLLSPIQRICQYPLQLNELFKYTPIEHKDYENIHQALNTMRDVASFINEKKRRMESVEVIHKWQATVDNWQGKNLIETSTQGLGRADAYLYQNGKKEQVTLFLFDHVLIICKKDRKNSLVYFGRADLDNSEFEDLIDGKVSRLDEENLVHLLFAWRLYDRLQNRTYLFAHRTPIDKMQMIDALEYERAYVEENLSKGLEIPLYTRLTTLQTQQYLAEQPIPMSRSTTATSFPLITKPNRSISAILRTSNSQSTTNTSVDHPPVSRRRFVSSRKSSLPRFVRSSSRDSSIDESLRSTKSRFRFWS